MDGYFQLKMILLDDTTNSLPFLDHQFLVQASFLNFPLLRKHHRTLVLLCPSQHKLYQGLTLAFGKS
jgi:hypothetical protein